MSSRIFAPGLLDGQVCVVSGAGTGLGKATALELTSLGATVIGCGRREEPLQGMVDQVAAGGGKAEFEALDIRDDEAVDGFMDGIVERHGRIDLLVNNAGGQFLSPAEAISPKGFRTVIELNIEGTWLFMERGDTSLIGSEELPSLPSELRMRIVEAQEAERARLAQEVHDGPAQALSNAIFQVEFIDRVFESDPPMARAELRFLRELLRLELGDVRSFIGSLRPPVLVELGLDGSIVDTVTTQAALSGLHITTELAGPADGLGDAAQTVVLRVVQEALQNVRKHAGAANVVITTALEDGQWVLEVRDDGRGFDTGAVAARGRRNFGLQFMRERAELVGAQFEVRSRPEAGTVVRLAIPVPRKENG